MQYLECGLGNERVLCFFARIGCVLCIWCRNSCLFVLFIYCYMFGIALDKFRYYDFCFLLTAFLRFYLWCYLFWRLYLCLTLCKCNNCFIFYENTWTLPNLFLCFFLLSFYFVLFSVAGCNNRCLVKCVCYCLIFKFSGCCYKWMFC